MAVGILQKIFLEKLPTKSPYLDNKFQDVTHTIRNNPNFFLMSSLTCGQIWLTLLVKDNHRPTYLTKLQKTIFFKTEKEFLGGGG
jgi:hypothetical protein